MSPRCCAMHTSSRSSQSAQSFSCLRVVSHTARCRCNHNNSNRSRNSNDGGSNSSVNCSAQACSRHLSKQRCSQESSSCRATNNQARLLLMALTTALSTGSRAASSSSQSDQGSSGNGHTIQLQRLAGNQTVLAHTPINLKGLKQ